MEVDVGDSSIRTKTIANTNAYIARGHLHRVSTCSVSRLGFPLYARISNIDNHGMYKLWGSNSDREFGITIIFKIEKTGYTLHGTVIKSEDTIGEGAFASYSSVGSGDLESTSGDRGVSRYH